jgi:uroporphyrinogen-III synthase
MREVPLEENTAARELVARLEAGAIDDVLLLTGVGLRTLIDAVADVTPAERLAQLLGSANLVARGPKPVAELRKLGLAPDVRVPEPNTWHEVLAALDAEAPVRGKRVAVLEYGKPNDELTRALAQRGADVMRVALYRWALPQDTGPLEQAVARLASGDAGYVLFMSSRQVDHAMEVAAAQGVADDVRERAATLVYGSIGPVCSDALAQHGLPVDLEPEHPKMGHLVVAIARRGGALLAAKRGAPPAG